MARTSIFLAAAIFLSAVASAASAAPPCRDDKGKFIKCEAVAQKGPCRDDKGKFIKCTATASTKAPAGVATASAKTPAKK